MVFCWKIDYAHEELCCDRIPTCWSRFFVAFVPEAMDPVGEFFSGQRLEQCLAQTHGAFPRHMGGGLGDEVGKCAAGALQSEDVTALAWQYAGPAAGGARRGDTA